ncbi:hypothetical protein AB0L59_02340 [Streptomyces sp. NPDC052109]|uniref:hypothetical protein n=1 Tax=Streptomyces sp. NPDC052109 TaxID=3155527 RepID=UPI00342CE8F3
MFTARKIATVSGLVGSLAAFCVGAGHAYADGPSDGCKNTEQGGTVCVHKNETRTDKDGAHVLKQTLDCSTSDRPRVVFPERQMLDSESSGVGQTVDCSNTEKLPKGLKKPHFWF